MDTPEGTIKKLRELLREGYYKTDDSMIISLSKEEARNIIFFITKALYSINNLKQD